MSQCQYELSRNEVDRVEGSRNEGSRNEGSRNEGSRNEVDRVEVNRNVGGRRSKVVRRNNIVHRVASPPLTPSQLPVIKTSVQNLNLEWVKPQRAGVVIYIVYNGAVYFGFGLDAKTHDLTDFAGSVMYKLDHNVVRGALREFEEETLQIFDPITPEMVKSCPVIYDSNNLIIFVHLSLNPDIICKTFNHRYDQILKNIKPQRKTRYPEVCGITWLSWEDLQKGITEKGILFNRVQRFLQRAGDFSCIL